jgi:ligand-binding SRPBCC domain-containing protein
VKVHELRVELSVSRPRAEVFAFFADAANLQVLTPSFVDFRIVTPAPIEMRRGARIEYRLRIHGIPVRWESEITVWDPPVRFVDEQLRGPYRSWVHEHRFAEEATGTRITDHVRYAVPGGPLEGLVHRWLVRPDVERIFAYRSAVLAQRYGAAPAAS